MLSIYPACFFHENDSYSVVFPDLNHLATQGDTLEEAMEMAVDCLAGYLYTCKRDGDSIPEASALADVDPEAIAREIDPEAPACQAFVNLVAVDVDSYAKAHFEKTVEKTIRIPAWLNTAAAAENIDFSQVLQEGLKQRLHMG